MPVMCNHCDDAPCMKAAKNGAVRKRPDGIVIIDQDKCMGCKYCMMACPYRIPRYMWERSVPYISKCTMCFDAIARGEIELSE